VSRERDESIDDEVDDWSARSDAERALKIMASNSFSRPEDEVNPRSREQTAIART
jgi:hypothetical protein